MSQPRISRRRLLRLSATLPLGALVAACGGAPEKVIDAIDPPPPQPTATSTPEPPFIVAAGEKERLLLAGTQQETPVYIFGSGQPGKVAMLLGGVHGNEPGGWLAAERLLDRLRPAKGALLILPRANRNAIEGFVRTTDWLGDLNRLYPGAVDGLPMAQMAAQIVALLRAFRVDVLVDMHESWAFYKDRPQNGTAFLGQTVATDPSEAAIAFARGIVEAENSRILSPQEEFFFRERVGGTGGQTPSSTNIPGAGGSTSSLGLPRYLEKLTVLLVEMGQQQTLERRIAMHVDIATEVARRSGIVEA